MNKSVNEMADMIRVRNHIYVMVNGPRTTLISKEEEKDLREFANVLDRQVVDRCLDIRKAMMAAEEDKAPEAPEDKAPEAPVVVAAKTTKAEPPKEEKKKGLVRRVTE